MKLALTIIMSLAFASAAFAEVGTNGVECPYKKNSRLFAQTNPTVDNVQQAVVGSGSIHSQK